MKNYLCIFLVIAAISCDKPLPKTQNIVEENLTEKQIDSVLTEFKFDYDTPIILKDTTQILIPIATKLLNRRAAFSSDSYFSEDLPRYWNVLFYNSKTSKTRLLTNDKFRISEIITKPNRDIYLDNSNNYFENILYKISDIDYNLDGQLNSKDPEFLFVSDSNGENLKRVSPQNEHLNYYKVIRDNKEIILETIRDINNDSIFNHKDEYIWYKSQLVNNSWVNTEIIDSKNRDKIEKLYFEQWLKKKNERTTLAK